MRKKKKVWSKAPWLETVKKSKACQNWKKNLIES